MSTFEDFVNKTNQCSTSEEVLDILKSTLGNLGYNHIIYSTFTFHPTFGLDAQHGIVSTYPIEWLDFYNENEYFRKDPVCIEATSNPNPFSWSWLKESTNCTPEQMRIMDEATDFNLLDGIAIPIYGPLGEIAGLGLASETLDIQTDENALSLLRAITNQFHLSYNRFAPDDEKTERIQLSNREKEILMWAAEGKNDAAIADILNVAYPTVRYHLANAFAKLGAKERTMAVVKALRLGLINPILLKQNDKNT